MSDAPVKIKIVSTDTVREVAVTPGENLLSVLRTEGCYVASHCSGKGFCGKCKVRCKGDVPVSDLDRRFLRDSEISTGIRLACGVTPFDGMVVYAEKEDVLLRADEFSEPAAEKGEELFLAVDIGTTTVALKFITPSGENAGAVVFNNPQRIYGADVAARISCAAGGKGEELKKLITEKIASEADALLEKIHAEPEHVKKCAVACNTTMGHILMGYDCSGLGAYPFTAVTLDEVKFTFAEVFTGSRINCGSVLLPGFSAYIGGDITAGIFVSGMAEKEEMSLLMDLGTNGEMALGNKDKILTASAAAGPAFEGGNISCGCGSVPGAINSVCIAGGRAVCSTVGGFPVTGICGTGVIDITASLIRQGIVDKSGFFTEDYAEYGYPLTRDGQYRFVQDDVRQVQLAKSAVRAGLETLMEKSGCRAGDIKNVYIAGGFSRAINLKNAAVIGLIPEAFTAGAKCIGNSSLDGAAAFLTREDAPGKIARIKEITSEIILANEDSFNDRFIDEIEFG